MKYLYRVNVAPGIHYECLGDEALHLKRGDDVVLRCEHYQDFGVIANCLDEEAEAAGGDGDKNSGRGRQIQGRRTPEVIRRATLGDRGKKHENDAMSNSMHKSARRKIQEHNLPMKLLNSHVSFDGNLAIFQFSSEGRVDFRKLLRDLSTVLHCRVELRQVGVRDEAAIQGGIGCCGRVFCCTTFLDEFTSINVKMAKSQGLSLNPSNISGACGRLKCCLKYEDEAYRELNRGIPRNGSRCVTPEGEGRIIDSNVLTQTVRVALDKDDQIAQFSAEEVQEQPKQDVKKKKV